MHARGHRKFSPWMRLGVVLAGLAVLLAPLTAPAPATAAGSGVLNVTIEPVDYATGQPQSSAAYGTHGDRVAYKVSYSCLSAECESTTIRLAPAQPDPYGLAAQANPATMAKTLLT